MMFQSWIRSAAITCINSWGDQCGYREFFDGEMVADALKSGSPTLRSELWCWLAEKLPKGVNHYLLCDLLVFYSISRFDITPKAEQRATVLI